MIALMLTIALRVAACVGCEPQDQGPVSDTFNWYDGAEDRAGIYYNSEFDELWWLGPDLFVWGSLVEFPDQCDKPGLVFCMGHLQPMYLPLNADQEIQTDDGFRVYVNYERQFGSLCDSRFAVVTNESDAHVVEYVFSREFGLTFMQMRDLDNGNWVETVYALVGGAPINYLKMICDVQY